MDNENLKLYNEVRAVPKEAQKDFDNGSFKGTDINPMWRIKTLTDKFGPAGFGWYYEILSERYEEHHDTTMAIVDLNLYVKMNGEWSKPIFGTGGNKLVQSTRSGPRASDEGYKMALTDALSVACKALGIGADVYWEKDKTKYTASDASPAPQERKEAPRASKNTTKPTNEQKPQPADEIEAYVDHTTIGAERITRLGEAIDGTGAKLDDIVKWAQGRLHKSLKVATEEEFQSLLDAINEKKAKNERKEQDNE